MSWKINEIQKMRYSDKSKSLFYQFRRYHRNAVHTYVKYYIRQFFHCSSRIMICRLSVLILTSSFKKARWPTGLRKESWFDLCVCCLWMTMKSDLWSFTGRDFNTFNTTIQIHNLKWIRTCLFEIASSKNCLTIKIKFLSQHVNQFWNEIE